MLNMQKNPVELIQEKLGQDELLCQLAEEAAELAQAALKLRRAYMGINPTPIKRSKAYEELLEEIADVGLCLEVAGYGDGLSRMSISRIKQEKLDRWGKRLQGKEAVV